MVQGSLGKVLRRTLLRLGGETGSPDGQLLDRFVVGHNEDAFAELVRRHGPMVLRVCQRALHHAQDAEDAFQATFIVLARKAASIAQPALLANWLYGVAARVAGEARAAAVRRRMRELLTEEPGRDLETGGGLQTEKDWRLTLDEELSRLPSNYRAPVVLCYLEGKSNAEAAQLLGCRTVAIEKRLSRARSLLRQRLQRRGLVLSATALAALLASEAPVAGAVLPVLAERASQAAVLAGTGAASAVAAGLLSTPARQLADATLMVMKFSRLKVIAAAVGAAALVNLMVVLGVLLARPSPELASKLPEKAGFTLPGLGPVIHVSLSPDGKTLVAEQPADCFVYDLSTGQTRLAWHATTNNRSPGVALSPDGKLLAVLDGSAVQLLAARPDQNDLVSVWRLDSPDKDRLYTAVTFSPDSQTLAVARGGNIELLDVATGRERARLASGYVRCLAFLPDGKSLVSAHVSVHLHDVASGRELLCTTPQKAIFGMAVTRDIVVTRSAMEVNLWSVATGQLQATIDARAYAVHDDVAIAADGRFLAWGLQEPGCGIMIWNIAAGRAETVLMGQHSRFVKCVAFSADGKTLVSGGADNMVRLWNLHK
jgi:RNA polymerase sigma factor (sigma-70 family)